MKIYACITVAQEIDGKNLMIRFDKVTTKKDDLEKYVANNKSAWVEKMGSPQGMIDFACERHPHEIEVEDL